MASKTQIVNLALGRIGVSKQVANVETENSTEAKAARLAFDDERDYVLRDFAWPFATSYGELGLVEGTSAVAVNYDWHYSYRYPADCINVRRILTANGRREPKPPAFRIGRDAQGRLIYTDTADAEIEYTVRILDPAEFDPLAVSMLAWKLASVLAPALSRIEKMSEQCMKMYLVDKSVAESGASNENQEAVALEAEMIRARE